MARQEGKSPARSRSHSGPRRIQDQIANRLETPIIIWRTLLNGQYTIMNERQIRPRPPFAARPKQWSPRPTHPEPQNYPNARRNYDRYLALAQAEAQNGNTVAAENYYQYAEHYFRSMSSTSEGS
jgi:hypothetical protein